MESYLKFDISFEGNLEPEVTAYVLISWILEASSASNGFGFPFDQPHLEFYLRLQEAHPALKLLKEKGISLLPLNVLNRTLKDCTLKKWVSHIQEKISIFEELRASMRISWKENNQGLNDEGFDTIKTIESRVKKFRNDAKIVALASHSTSYHKMIKQIDKYWDKLFADPIEVETPTGKVTIQPQRTNNIMEQSFRFLKRDGRKKSGQHSLTKTLKWMLADTQLVRNLSNSDYMEILLKGKRNLAERFADIDIQQVRIEEKENEQRFQSYPKRMSKLFRIPHLPLKLMKIPAK